MLKKVLSYILVTCLLFSFVLAVAEEDETVSEPIKVDETSINDEVVSFTLEEAVNSALEHNLTWRITNKQLELQNLQVDIVDDLNNDLRKAERDLRHSEEMLSDSILALQTEIAFIKGLTFNPNVLNEHWDVLMARPVSGNYLNKLIGQYGDISIVKGLPPEALITVLETANGESSAAYFEIRSGKNTTIQQANSTAASLLGLKSTRKLTMKQALKLIETSAAHGSSLLKKADEDAQRGIELMAENSFYNVLQSQKVLNVQQKAVERAEEQYTIAGKSFEQGLISKNDMQMALLQLNNMKASKYSAEVDLNKANMDFCVALGLPLGQKFTLIEPEWDFNQVPLGEGLAIAKLNRTDMITAQQALDLAELNMEYVDEKYREKSTEYLESALYLEQKDLEYEQAWLKAETSIKKAYYDWQNADFAYQLMLSNLQLVQSQLHVAQVSYNIGYSSGSSSPLVTLLQAQEQVASMEQGVAAAEFGRNLAWQNYLKEISYDKTADYVTIDQEK